MSGTDGTIDITNAVAAAQSSFVTAAETYLTGLILAVPGLGWLAYPIISALFGSALKWVLNKLSEWAVMQAFFLNTTMRKASQAQDLIDALNAKNNLPPTATDDEYAKAEQAQILAFNNFVVFTN